MIAMLLGALLTMLVPEPQQGVINPEPNINLSAIRLLECDLGYGTGWLIGDNILVTANHVAEAGNCKDAATGAKLKTYKVDLSHDLALMSGKLPKMSYIKYHCGGYTAGKEYLNIGISSFLWRPEPILRMDRLIATDYVTDNSFIVEGSPMPGMRFLKGYSVPGKSGSPLFDGDYAVGILNVGVSSNQGLVTQPKEYSYSLSDTILCHG